MSTVKFKDITTVEQLRTRIVNGVLSVGNKYGDVRKFFKNERVSCDQIEVSVVYTAGSGLHAVTRFV